MGMLSLRINGFRPKIPPTDPSRIALGLEGYIHQVHSCAPSDQETQPSMSTPRPLLKARGLARTLSSRSMTLPSLVLGSCLAYNASQGPSTRRHAPSHRGSRAPRCYTLGVALPAAPLIGSRKGRDTRRQALLSLQGLEGYQAHVLAS
jgi:hypothetical protein